MSPVKIALYGPYMFELAIGLRENPANNVRLFLDDQSIPRSLLEEPLLKDQNFVEIGPWATRKAILNPKRAQITKSLSGYDVALVTELGPIFAAESETEFVFLPTGWDLTCGSFPVRSRSMRSRGLSDVSAAVVARQLRAGIRSALDTWTPAIFAPWALGAQRLGIELDRWLPQPIDTRLFTPMSDQERVDRGQGRLTIFHPSRMMFRPSRFLIETGQYKRNDVLLRGFSQAVKQGVDAQLVLIERASSPDQSLAKELIEALGITKSVKWLNPGVETGYTWRELSDLYRTADLVADEFGGSWFGLGSLEGAACGIPVLNYVDPDVMDLAYPHGWPFIQVRDEEAVCEAIDMLTDPEKRDSIGRESRQWILDHHDRNGVARRCESMLLELGFS